MSDDVGRNANETLQENIGTILFNFSQDDKQLIRKLESLSKKEVNARYAVIFNETYILIYCKVYCHSSIGVQLDGCLPRLGVRAATVFDIPGLYTAQA